MKKLLVLMLIFGIASVANAGMMLSINGDPAPSAITLSTSDTITLDIMVEEGTWLSGGDLNIKLSNDKGSLDSSGATFETEPMTRYYFGMPAYSIPYDWYEQAKAWDAPWSVLTSSSTSVIMSGGNNVGSGSGNTKGAYTLADGIVFHCEEETDVIIDLVAFSDLVYMTYDTAAPPGVEDLVAIYDMGEIIDSIHVTQIPEPMTIVLLGLGGLFLRRRK